VTPIASQSPTASAAAAKTETAENYIDPDDHQYHWATEDVGSSVLIYNKTTTTSPAVIAMQLQIANDALLASEAVAA
jgi:hypothetical protein